MRMCSMDFIVGLTPTKQGHDAIFGCVDKLRKMAHLMATTTYVTAKEEGPFMVEVFLLGHMT